MDKGAPTSHPLARYAEFGCPWHGLVTGGILPLSNGYSMPYPQPATTFADRAGDTHLVRRPGMPEIVRTVEQQAADAAAGMEWRNVAMLSGMRQQLYGMPLDGWIYIDSAGDRWRVSTGTLTASPKTLSAPLEFVVTLSRYGKIPGTEESYTHNVVLSDMGQSSPALTLSGVDLTTARMRIFAIQPTGNAAAVMIAATRFNLPGAAPNIDNHSSYALGWLEISISGVGSAASVSATVLRTRAQTVQRVADPYPDLGSWTHQAGVMSWHGGADFSLLHESGDPWPPPGITTPYNFSPYVVIYTGAGSWGRIFSNIIAMWPDGAGGWSEVVLESEESNTYSNPSPSAPSASVPCEVTRTSTAASSAAIRVKVGLSVVVEIGASSSYEVVQSWSSVGFGVLTTSFALTGDIDGQPTSKTGYGVVDGATEAVVIGATIAAGAGASPSAGATSPALDLPYLACSVGCEDSGGSIVIGVSIARNSNNVLSVIAEKKVDGVVEYSRVHSVITPDGATAYDSALASSLLATRYYGSWCPHTGAVSYMQTQPVCWV